MQIKVEGRLILFMIVFILLGLLTIHSASTVWTTYLYDDPYFYMKRQALFSIIGVGCMIFIRKIPLNDMKKYVPLLFICTLILLALVLIPGIGIVRGGARSWIGIGSFSIQPSEFMKIALILMAAYIFERFRNHPFLLIQLLTLMVFALIMLQPDLGTGLVLLGTIFDLMYVYGLKMKVIIWTALLGLTGLVILIVSAPYRLRRLTSYLNPWADPQGDGFQMIQSLLAIGPGKLFGRGYQNGMQKHFYLPEPQTDFIFAIYAEEFGYIGAVLFVLAVLWLFLFCMKVSQAIYDSFKRTVFIGIVMMITLQMVMNISVVIGLIPVTGITLPFMSYGGSSLVLTFISYGLLLNITKRLKI